MARRRQRQTPTLPPPFDTYRPYTREVIDVHNAAVADVDRERLTAVRLERQNMLARRHPAPPYLDVILNEHVLRHPINDRQAMAGQLDHLAQVSQRANVSIRVLPMDAGLHPAATTGAFAILDFPSNGAREPEPSTVYSEGLTGALYLDKLSEVEAYVTVWNGLEPLSLDERESMMLIRAVAEEYAS